MELDLNELERRAKAATPGKWTWKQIGSFNTPGCAVFWPDTSKGGVHYRRLDSGGGMIEADANFIAAANPAVVLELVRRLREAEARVAELEAERAKQEKQDPAAYLTADKNMLVFADKCVDMKHLMTPLYADPPVTAQAEGYVTALRYIAWEAAGYMDCVHAAKRAIGEMGALPPPPKIQPPKGRD